MTKRLGIYLTAFMLSQTLPAQIQYNVSKHTSPKGYTWEEVSNDPTHTRVYRLKNGLTVYLSRNTNTPRIQTYIPVRAGSNHDPKDNTGLAHYLEHMLFKGTSKLGSLDWGQERLALQKISNLYEQLKRTDISSERSKIYKQIDSISQLAARYVSPNEYDRLIAALGGQNTNAHTWVEETVYQNDIPSTELERWLQIESERFGELTLRLFHTEIEAVYEEFNMGQDKVFRKVFETLNKHLFPTHPLGQQTTIGTSQHLKNPSLVALHNYFDRYYTPTNYALVLVGDLDYDHTIALIDKYFGAKPARKVEQPTFAKEQPLKGAQSYEVRSKDPEQLYIGFRQAGGAGSQDEVYMTLINMLLSNGQAGFIDLNLNQTQAVQDAGSYALFHNDYNVLYLYAYPKIGQSLEEAQRLLLSQLELIKQGKFADWMLSAVVNDTELQQTKSYLRNEDVGTMLYKLFINGRTLENGLSFIERLRAVSKDELVAYARQHLRDNYVTVFKRQGEDTDLVRVENPSITPLTLDQQALSPFAKHILAQKPSSLSPQWVDYKQLIKRTTIGGQEVEYILNKDNDLFELAFIFKLGSNHDNRLKLALSYLDYLGTDKLSPEQVKQEFYKLGVNYGTKVEAEQTTLTLSGLGRNLSQALHLLDSFLKHLKPNEETMEQLRQATYQSRHDAKTKKEDIFSELRSFVLYGEQTPTRRNISRQELDKLTSQDLINVIQKLNLYPKRVFYYGKQLETLSKSLGNYLTPPQENYTQAPRYTQLPTGGKVYYVDYDMVQTQVMMIRRVKPFDVREMALQRLFNAYFGGGMSSIVFQDIREAKSLAYSTYAIYGGATKPEDYNSMSAFVSTQSNKLTEAIEALSNLLKDMPVAIHSFETARTSVLKDLESERITRQDIFWRYERLKRLGLDHDPREAVYQEVQRLSLDDLKAYFEQTIKGDDYSYILIGREQDLPLEALKQYGEVVKLDVDYLFGNKE